MTSTGRIKSPWLLIPMSMGLLNAGITSGESSGEYLQKAMIELQELNMPSNSDIINRMSASANNKDGIYVRKDGANRMNHRISVIGQQDQKFQSDDFQSLDITPTSKADVQHTDSPTVPQYYPVRTPFVTKSRDPEVLGITRAELAELYKNTLEKGSVISLSSLKEALANAKLPRVTENRLELPVKEPIYRYYFFPLKTFMSELKKEQAYKNGASHFENTETAESTQTHIVNPLFVAITTFVSMAIIFMIGILFFPKLTQYGIFNARDMQDDFLRLSEVVTNAIHRHSLLDKFPDRQRKLNRYEIAPRKKKNKRKGTS
ncbi:hypothetical protein KM043_009454 [Ampulex compressa]|nr:hypothetical protein KM043_009454 [Ampulex compressa]